MNARGRPRIPTPDVQKDGAIDKDNKQNISVNGTIQPGTYPSDIPAVVQVIHFIYCTIGEKKCTKKHNFLSIIPIVESLILINDNL